MHAMRNTDTTKQKQDARKTLIRQNKKRGKQLKAQYSTTTPKETLHTHCKQSRIGRNQYHPHSRNEKH